MMMSFSTWKRRSSKKGKRKPARGERGIRKPPTVQVQSEVDVDVGSDGKQ